MEPEADPIPQPQYRDVKWSEDGPTFINPIEGSGGFLLFEQIEPKNPRQADHYLRVFVGYGTKNFSWTTQKTETWHVVDVPNGFSINAVDALKTHLPKPPGGAGGPVIVHGRP
jgi:hypothetical protein